MVRSGRNKLNTSKWREACSESSTRMSGELSLAALRVSIPEYFASWLSLRRCSQTFRGVVNLPQDQGLAAYGSKSIWTQRDPAVHAG